ncbi:MAG: ABC transporter permease [Corynebacterium sp.]|uniref:ABC transporter permease n=1 Tax=Corynebacterium sp. TaxID=1720 RepID=UPI0026DB0AA4|nr:ABC transporter permease [Corynebacterium sp.]MDO5030865.1 ABC transporter permease [Corynebacterium sp.]
MKKGPKYYSPRVIVAVVLLMVIGLYALLAPLLSGADLVLTDFANSGASPGREHFFGTDSQGHDVFLRVAAGMRISLFIAIVTAVFSAVVGVALGVVAGMVGGRVDRIIMRGADVTNALPHLLLGLLIVSLFRGSIMAIIASLVLTHWVTITRTVRASVLHLRNAEFVEAALLSGMSRVGVLVRHVVPAALGQSLVGLVLLIPHVIWHESTLSFLGVGLPPHKPSLGTLLADAEGALLLGHWWILVFPSFFLVATTLCIAAIGNHLKNRITGQEVLV